MFIHDEMMQYAFSNGTFLQIVYCTSHNAAEYRHVFSFDVLLKQFHHYYFYYTDHKADEFHRELP